MRIFDSFAQMARVNSSRAKIQITLYVTAKSMMFVTSLAHVIQKMTILFMVGKALTELPSCVSRKAELDCLFAFDLAELIT